MDLVQADHGAPWRNFSGPPDVLILKRKLQVTSPRSGAKQNGARRTVMQRFGDTLAQVFRAIAANKLRSFLTMFGIAWGVGSLLVLVGLGEGFRSGQHRNLARFGNDVVLMWN